MNLLLRLSKFSLVIIIALAVNTAYGQDKESNNPYAGLPFKDRLFFGGDLGLSFGTVTFIRISPIIGFNVSPKFSVGGGPSYQYYKDNRYVGVESSIYGGSVFGRYFVIENIFLQTEFEVLNLEQLYYNSTTDFIPERVTIPVWFVGAGFSQRTPNGSGFFIGLFYDLIGDLNSPYPSNIAVRAGGMISF